MFSLDLNFLKESYTVFYTRVFPIFIRALTSFEIYSESVILRGKMHPFLSPSKYFILLSRSELHLLLGVFTSPLPMHLDLKASTKL